MGFDGAETNNLELQAFQAGDVFELYILLYDALELYRYFTPFACSLHFT